MKSVKRFEMSGKWLWIALVLSGAACRPEGDPMAGAGEEQALKASRTIMVREQLIERNISNLRVLEAMERTPRHEFVPDSLRNAAYGDHPLPIGHDQTISQPYIVAFMTEHLDPGPEDRVLEIGTGSGYQAAVLAALVGHVYSIEIIEPLAQRAAATLDRLGYKNVSVRTGDGYAGWPERAPFDAIIVTCAPDRIPEPLVDQLKEGGKMVVPVGPARDQKLFVMEKRDGEMIERAVLPVRFVPMTGPGIEEPAQD